MLPIMIMVCRRQAHAVVAMLPTPVIIRATITTIITRTLADTQAITSRTRSAA